MSSNKQRLDKIEEDIKAIDARLRELAERLLRLELQLSLQQGSPQ